MIADLHTAADTTTADLKAVDAQIADARGRLGRLYAALESEGRTTGALELNELAPRIREWKAKLDEVEIQRVELVAKAEIKARPVMDAATVTAYIRELSGLLATGPLAARKAFLRSFIQRVDATGYDFAVTYTLPPLPEPGGGRPAAANEAGGEFPLRKAAGAEGADLRVGDGISGLGRSDAEKAGVRFPRVLPIGKDGSRAGAGGRADRASRGAPGQHHPRGEPGAAGRADRRLQGGQRAAAGASTLGQRRCLVALRMSGSRRAV